MKNIALTLVLLSFVLSACATDVPPTAALTLDCAQKGTIGNDRVSDPTHGFDSISFDYYLPPCYESLNNQHFPVMYLMTLTSESALSETDNTPISLAERLIRAGKLPPVIIIVPGQLLGYGSDTALTKDLVPYVDRTFRTISNREHRVTGGISNGAAVAVRMAFQYPESFSRVAVLSGGLSEGEVERFDGWVRRTPPLYRPQVRIDVGKQDAIMPYTETLVKILEKHHLSHTLDISQGNHNWAFWSGRMEPVLLWLAKGW